jgi:hypothetical protein
MKQTVLAMTGLVAIALFPGAVLAQEIPKTLKQGMPYAQARKILIQSGWQAVAWSPNRARFEIPARGRFGAMDYLINNLGYTEVESCSGTGMGFCRFSFTNAKSETLAVVTIDNQPGQQPKLQRWWLDTEK